MAFIDYYQALGIDKSATEKDIKNAYRKMARKYHPDVNPDDKDAQRKFQEINEANEVLSDPEKRKKYDQYGENWKHGDQFQQSGQSGQRSQQDWSQNDFGGFGGGQFSDDYSDFFASMFGRGKGRQGGFRGQDLRAELQLSLRDVYTSRTQTLTVNGKNIRLTIPAGVEDGQTIRIKGHGGQGQAGGHAGDLLITFKISNDTGFKRSGADLYNTVDIGLLTALAGGEITVNTFDGKVKLNVTPGTQNNTKVKLKGKGFPVYKKDGSFGDLFITYQVKIPTDLSGEQLSKLREILDK